jgi:anion-transporting  ArsA/GET3 family ATPase
MAADAGLEVLVVALDDAGALPSLFGTEDSFGYEEVLLYQAPEGSVRGRVITPDDALLDYLMDHGMGRIAKRLTKAGILDIVSTAIPGIREILVLGKVKQLERGDTPDLVILDAPATGHAIKFLTSATGLLDAARGAGPLRTQATEVVEMLHDPERCQVILVTLAEETPVNELIETAWRLEDELGIVLGPVLVNALYDQIAVLTAPSELAAAAGEELAAGAAERLAAAAAWRGARQALQGEQLDRLDTGMPLPRLNLPYLFCSDFGPDEVGALAGALGRAIDGLEGGP